MIKSIKTLISKNNHDKKKTYEHEYAVFTMNYSQCTPQSPKKNIYIYNVDNKNLSHCITRVCYKYCL